MKPAIKLFTSQTAVLNQANVTPAAQTSSDIVIPQLVDTLEWVLDSPPNVHQFDEPPVSI